MDKQNNWLELKTSITFFLITQFIYIFIINKNVTRICNSPPPIYLRSANTLMSFRHYIHIFTSF